MHEIAKQNLPPLRQISANATDAEELQQVANCYSITTPGCREDEWSPLCFSRSPQLCNHASKTFVLKIKAVKGISTTLCVSCLTVNNDLPNKFIQLWHIAVHTERHLYSRLEILCLLLFSPSRNPLLWILPQRGERPLLSPELTF